METGTSQVLKNINYWGQVVYYLGIKKVQMNGLPISSSSACCGVRGHILPICLPRIYLSGPKNSMGVFYSIFSATDRYVCFSLSPLHLYDTFMELS